MIIGIDLGTTNSLVAIWRDGKPQLIPNALGHVMTPSCVSIADDGSVLVGLPARDRLLTHPQLSTHAFKRYMGTQHQVRLGHRTFRPEELSAMVLGALKRDAEAFLGEPVLEAVITVPAYFNNTQRAATRTAGELAGLKVERLLNEPTAAALAYGLHHADPESQFLVFDLGGGTFDVSILELFAGVMEVRATAGDNFLGGEDFVSLLVDNFRAEAGSKAGLGTQAFPTEDQVARLRLEAERVKRALSNSDRVVFTYRDGEQVTEWPVTSQQFEQMSAPLLERLRAPVERAVRDARLLPDQLSNIVLVGGSTRMPIVHRMVSRMFGRFPNRDINPDEAIALGAAVQAGLKARDSALDEVVLTDVCPYTLGIETSRELRPGEVVDGLYLPLIERNTVIPASRSRQVVALRDYQPEIIVRVFQGESPDVKDNVPLGHLRVPLPNVPRAESGVEVRFTYDINGLLEVEAMVQVSGKRLSLVIEQAPGTMTPEEIRQSLKALEGLKVHPRDQAENQAVIARIKRLYEQATGNDRLWMLDILSQFEAVLARQDPQEIARARSEVVKVLDGIDGKPVL